MKLKIFFLSLLLFLPLAGSAQTLDTAQYGDTNGDFIIDESDQEIRLSPEDIPSNEYSQALVTEIVNEYTEQVADDYLEQIQELKVRILSGIESGQEISIINRGISSLEKYQKVAVGDKIILAKVYKVDGTADYYFADHYRLQPLLIILLIFFALVIWFGRWKGLGSLAGLFISILVLAGFIVPRVVAGQNPIIITLLGALIISAVSMYLGHGFNRRTTLAFIGMMITLSIAMLLAYIFIDFSSLFGKGSEEAFYLQFGELAAINLRGLLLAGIIIGTLGVLDDIATAQTAVVGELRRANPSLSQRELYQRGLIVGREHIASLVNTLVLAYAGAALPLFILFNINQEYPWWMKFNSEMIAEEFVRTIIGSLALILAVPISTYLAAVFLKNEKPLKHSSPEHFHHH